MSGRVPEWLADWLGLEPSTSGDAATWRLDSAWNWPPWATVLLVLLAIAWVVAIYAREGGSAGRLYRGVLAALRLAALAALLVMLAQWALAVRLTGPPAIVLVIDRSASMAIADHYNDESWTAELGRRLNSAGLEGATRLNLAKALLSEGDGRVLNELSRRYRLEVYFVSDGVERTPSAESTADALRAVRALSADGPGSQATRLGDAIRQALADFRAQPPAAIILLSDGVTTAGAPLVDAAEEARQLGVPLLAVGLGSDQAPRDVELADVLVDEAVFVDDVVSFHVQIKASGLAGEPARAILRRETPDGAALGELPIALPQSGETLTIQLTDRPAEAGDIAYIVEVPPRDDEIDAQNNHLRRVVSVREMKIRVLLIDSQPRYEFRYLKAMLEREPSIELSTYLQSADPDFAEQDETALRSFPVGRDELMRYDVLLVGDVDPRLLPRSVWQNVRAFAAEHRGGVAFIAGPRFMPSYYRENPDVAALLPVQPASPGRGSGNLPFEIARGFAVRPTPLGLVSPPLQLGDVPADTAPIWNGLAPLYWLAEIGELKPAAQVLAAAEPLRRNEWASPPDGERQSAIPLIVFQYVGAGRVLLHAMDSTWLWRRGAGDVYFARYWVQMIRFLARGRLTGGQGVRLTTDRRGYRPGEAVELRARFLDSRFAPASGESVLVAVGAPGQPRREVQLRRHPTIEGVFEGVLGELEAGSYEAIVTVPQPPGEPPTARFAVIAPPGELARPEMDRAALTTAAELSRGKFYTLADADRLLAELPAGRRVPLENLPPLTIWNRWWLLGVFLLCLTGEWILRKRRGML
jgi:hypothetical protein